MVWFTGMKGLGTYALPAKREKWLMAVIASIPELRKIPERIPVSMPRQASVADIQPVPTRTQADKQAGQPIASQRFPCRSILVLSVVAAACWMAAWWVDWHRDQEIMAHKNRSERVARELSATSSDARSVLP